ncbi:hypothetical protein P1J78_24435 [Psychromarinibacter sp. C21-152]|uniref:HdeA/HdeB family protein n=1 Tax=Psychromarinibacter sediminicola TaxID=3033385 RepID=A0AAE3NXF2_9RHOB|nr:hypothetical protein [Psychromarinibacter sediminicola]MDF0603866.1 hypothetical protein [Psychromarinibacter sediminicola]
MTKAPKLTFSALALIALSANTAHADVADDVAANVALFERLMDCSASASFYEEGFDQESPCRQWFLDVSAQRAAETDILAAGYDCTADELLMAGHMRWVGDAESFAAVEDKMEICRQQLTE